MFTFTIKYTLNGYEMHYQEVEATNPSHAIANFLGDPNHVDTDTEVWGNVEIKQVAIIIPPAQWFTAAGNIVVPNKAT